MDTKAMGKVLFAVLVIVLTILVLSVVACAPGGNAGEPSATGQQAKENLP